MGDNLYTDSVVALDADTGKLKWHFQFTPHDTHDWDATQVPVLADRVIGGDLRVVMVANQRLTRSIEPAADARRQAFVNTTWARDWSDGRPIVARQRTDAAGTTTCPDPSAAPTTCRRRSTRVAALRHCARNLRRTRAGSRSTSKGRRSTAAGCGERGELRRRARDRSVTADGSGSIDGESVAVGHAVDRVGTGVQRRLDETFCARRAHGAELWLISWRAGLRGADDGDDYGTQHVLMGLHGAHGVRAGIGRSQKAEVEGSRRTGTSR
jgi:hypothetical protein